MQSASQRLSPLREGDRARHTLGLTDAEIPVVLDDVPENQGRYIPGVGAQVVPASDDEIMGADWILLTAPTHVREMVQKLRARPGESPRILATTPDFHSVPVSDA